MLIKEVVLRSRKEWFYAFLFSITVIPGVLSFHGITANSIFEEPDTSDWQQVVFDSTLNKAHLVRQFDGPKGSPFKGLVLEGRRADGTSGRSIVAWGIGNYVIVGEVFGPSGEDITVAAAQREGVLHPNAVPKGGGQFQNAVPRAELSPDTIYDAALRLTGFVQGPGHGPNIALVFTSPSCTHCTRLKRQLEESEAEFADQMTIRWLPVGMNESDIMTAAQSLGGGVSLVRENTELLEKITGEHVVIPLLVWKSLETGEARVTRGIPKKPIWR